MNRFLQARQKEMAYHEQFYAATELFEPGNWMSRPVPIVMEQLQQFEHEAVQVLDLGCGVGRNSIPIAEQIQASGGQVTCVELLPMAVERLIANAEQYGVTDTIVPFAQDAEFFPIERNLYDYIVACCCLEHLSSEAEVFKYGSPYARGDEAWWYSLHSNEHER
ncbi:class I SAM-dependent methyltransferase [Paenibacillus gorillae]|uniref:class I SAM-dependent methyltransferase n=1 Tax=Paenibacillus gorillae TaxID=1243662 RepID=UPI0004B64E84|nr:class I SAM-dependent methyltransferase [Paenibacillus gorillae]